ncbi:MAG: SpoIIE family protein phosphatase [Chthoniobacterales bacterium]|nr:SpoIIE family protein phosphatase [Chthoniobacterales bacterium]
MFPLFGFYSVIILLVFLLGASIALAIILGAQRRRVGQLKRSRLEIKQEEGRVFDFLHGLGAAFCEGVCPSKLHRLVVEGAMRILSSTGGALYLVDRDENRLIPAFLTENTPPLVVIPDFINQPTPTLLSFYGVKSQAPSSIKSFLQLNTILPGQGLLGEAWEWKQPRFLDSHHLPEKLVAQGLDSVLLGPLIYGERTLGVLAVINGKDNSFSPGGLDLFGAIAEQSAFALYNQAVYKDAGEKRLLDHDLEIAAEVQKILLPSEAPLVSGYQISGVNIPARVLSGDYFDYLFIDEHLIGVAIADVSGKGIPASLIMALCRSALRSQAVTDSSPSNVLHKLNRQLYPDMREDMFISMAYVIINHKTDEALLARAGHDAPLFYRAADHSVERFNPKGMAVGVDSGEVFDRFCSDFSFRFEPGDCLLLYTDGVTEALNTHGLEFGMERLTKCLKENANNSSEILLKRLTDEIRLFINHQPQHDDITLIAIRKL